MRVINFGTRKVAVTSDTHYGHGNIINYCRRPFATPDEWDALLRYELRKQAAFEADEPFTEPSPKFSAETIARQNDALVAGINAVLGPDDVLIHAGDVAWKDLYTLFEFRERVTVRDIYVAIGNHDVEDELVAVFGRDKVMERFMIEVGGQRAVIDHYPGYSWQDSHKAAWLLFGHVHGAENAARRQNPAYALSIDVGVDSHEFRPWLWKEELVPLFAERRPQYDRWRAAKYPGKDGGGMAPVGPV